MAAGAEAFLEDAGAAGRPHCRTRASCWKRLERENVHASVGLADVWTVLERGLLLDRLKRARRRDPRGRTALPLVFLLRKNHDPVTKHTSPKCRPELILKETSSNLHFENL